MPKNSTDELPRLGTREKLILVVLLSAQFMFAADFSILTVALPVIGDSLEFELSQLQWIVTAFALSAAGFMLLFGRITDLYGRRRFFLVGMGLLTVASLVGGFADSPTELLVARIGQGLATAIVTPTALALVTTSFAEGPQRNRILGLSGALLASGFSAGAVLGGLLTDMLSWRWAFFINVPVGLFILVTAAVVLKESRNPQRQQLDVPGAVTVTLGMLALVYGISGAEQKGWTSAATLLTLLVAVVLLGGFFVIELRSRQPLVPVRVLKRRTVSWGNVGGLVTFSMASALAFLMTIYMEQVLHFSPLATGLAFGVWGITSVFGGIAAPKAMARWGGSRPALLVGLLIQALTTAPLLFVGTDRTAGLIMVVVCTALNGFGHVFAVVSYTVTATSGLPEAEQGLASGLATMTQQVAFTLGTPVISVAFTAGAGGVATAAGLLDGISAGLLLDGGVLLGGALLVGIFLVGRRHQEADAAGVDASAASVPDAGVQNATAAHK